jgi:MoaA/NifB/PqqE/SkfB family radical SAM enzyme
MFQRNATLNYWHNLFKLALGQRLLHPRVAIYYVTTQCNFNCAYCEDFGSRRNALAQAAPGEDWLPLDEVRRVLAVVRQGVDGLILTGGEPLLHRDIVDLVKLARQDLHFRQLTLTTNGLLLPKAEALLPFIDRLVISLDALDPRRWSRVIQMPVEAAQTVLENIRHYAGLQKAAGFRLILNAVLSPETLPEAEALLDFCLQHRILVSFSPQAVCNWPRYELVTSPEYRAFLTHLMAIKRRGGPVVGSLAYLRTLLDLRPFNCYPTLTPRIYPNGDLAYPCRPIEKSGHTHGGRTCNLRTIDSWDLARTIAAHQYGLPPLVCTSCFQQCYIEPALMQTQPLDLLRELVFYAPSRRAALDQYAPG